MLERERLESKKISKTQAVTSQIEHGALAADDVHIGPSDHVPWLNDRKWAYIRMEGRNFGDVPLNLELKLEVWDSPNSAGVIIDAVRCAKLALDRGIGGPLLGPSAYFMKSPPVQYHDDEADRMVEAFAAGEPGPSWPAGRLTAQASVPACSLAHHSSRRRRASSSPRGPSSRRSSSRNSSALPTVAARADAEVVHDLVAVELGADRVELLLARAAPRSAPRARPCAGRAPAPCRVAGGAVAAGQLVQPVEERPGVAHVAAHGAIGPPSR